MNGQASLFLSLYLHNKPSTTQRCTRSTLLINIHHTHTLTLVFNSRDLLSRTQRAACHDHIIERCVPNMCECTHTCVWVCQLEVRHPHTHTQANQVEHLNQTTTDHSLHVGKLRMLSYHLGGVKHRPPMLARGETSFGGIIIRSLPKLIISNRSAI